MRLDPRLYQRHLMLELVLDQLHPAFDDFLFDQFLLARTIAPGASLSTQLMGLMGGEL